jgi:meiotically up-regulated gene 157 (Mug157) protein
VSAGAHESFDTDDPEVFTRPWFAWANSLAGELIELVALEGLL